MASLLSPRLADPTAREPGLVVDVRDERRVLLFDLGDTLRALPPRVLLKATHAFVTHTHMDHFAGFDHLLAVGLGRMPSLSLHGGPGFVDQVEHKLRAYTWNVVHRYPQALVLDVHELRPDGRRAHARFSSAQAFARTDLPPPALHGDLLHDEQTLRVRGRFVEHEMPVLAYALQEQAHVRVAPDRIAAMGLRTGPWLGALKRAVLAGAPPDTPIDLAWRDRDGLHQARRTVGELQPLVLDTQPGRRIGYVTDLQGSEANAQVLQALLQGVDLLFIESVFLDADRDHAQRKNHLTARQAGEFARRLGARALVPFHFSPRYEGGYGALRDEAMAAWAGAAAAGPGAALGWPK